MLVFTRVTVSGKVNNTDVITTGADVAAARTLKRASAIGVLADGAVAEIRAKCECNRRSQTDLQLMGRDGYAEAGAPGNIISSMTFESPRLRYPCCPLVF
ncbi:hypothetical protein PoB_005902200 [Plakobranchus ocellatus]|uniref:Uncharacterized protein n=1 Tax=Plakobranchus ocellatus TaxID=259542 RepID=A0AAV4CL45_9GAST|nr:hypothetical protein PoB_005902200 [Plakobranchus ocellatus]